jgi:hypothetical protein
MHTDQDPQDHAIEVVGEEIAESLTSAWIAFLIGEPIEVQQRIVDNCAEFLFRELPEHLIAELVFRGFWPEAERRARGMVSQIPTESEDGDAGGHRSVVGGSDEA